MNTPFQAVIVALLVEASVINMVLSQSVIRRLNINSGSYTFVSTLMEILECSPFDEPEANACNFFF